MFASLWAKYHLSLQSYEIQYSRVTQGGKRFIYTQCYAIIGWLVRVIPKRIRFDRVKALAILKLTFFSNCSLRINDLENLIVVGFSSFFIIYSFYLFDFHLDNSSQNLNSAYLAFSALIKSNVALSVWDEKKSRNIFCLVATYIILPQ